MMPLITIAVVSYAAGLIAGFGNAGSTAVVIGAAAAAVALLRSRTVTVGACALLFATGALVAHEAPAPAARGSAYAANIATTPGSLLERWRAHAGESIDSLFGSDAPVVRALLIADTKQLPTDVRDRYARAGLVHILSISGLHVAIIAGAVLLALQVARVPVAAARWIAVILTAIYVAAIGAPAPALRSGSMLAAATAGRALQRPVSPWATLALGALVPILLDPRTVLDLGYQLSVCGFASITAAGIWAKRTIAPALRGARRRLATDLAVSTIASFASAPLVAWHFARISLIAPVSNIIASPIVAVMQPALFLAMLLAPFGLPAQIAADGARVLVRALDAVVRAAAAVPGGSITSAPSLANAVLAGIASLCLVAAASARGNRWRLLGGGCAAVALLAWSPFVPRPTRGMEVHMIDVGQGDAIALRSPRGRLVVVDAGGGRATGDAGRRVVVPYLRRLGGDVAMFVMTHPHDDHVGGAAALITLLRPDDIRDAAFAGTSASYRAALLSARDAGVPWRRIRPGDSTDVDGMVVTFLAPDSAWTASLRDPNLASAVMLVRYRDVRVLLTGDAESAEEQWLLARAASHAGADILKVAHHGSSTGTGGALLDAVRPRVALVSVGARNRYGHPSPAVVDSLRARNVLVARTDLLGSVVIRTDVAGARYDVVTQGGRVIAKGIPARRR